MQKALFSKLAALMTLHHAISKTKPLFSEGQIGGIVQDDKIQITGVIKRSHTIPAKDITAAKEGALHFNPPHSNQT